MNLILKSRPFIVLLGNSPINPIIINALNKDYDIVPYLYATTRPHHIPGTINYKFIRLKYPENLYYLLHTLTDFNSNEKNHYTTILIPISKIYEKFVEDHRDDLEQSFIIRSNVSLINSLPTVASKKELCIESL